MGVALHFFACACITCAAAPKGHMKVFGEHRPSEGEIHVVDKDITPEAFYRECVMPAKACVIKKVTESWPGWEKWRNDSYLASEFGHFNVTARQHLRHFSSSTPNRTRRVSCDMPFLVPLRIGC